MAKDYGQLPINAVRRSDREVTEEGWIKEFLHHAAVGALATVYDDQPFINTNLFVYDEAAHCIYTHTARVGRTQANVEQQRKVCFSIMAMGRMLPAPEALEFSVEYAGVMVFGNASIVEDDDEAVHGLQLLLDKYAPHLKAGEDYRPPVEEEVKRTAVYRIDIETWTGKKKEVASDFMGAFWYDEHPILESTRRRLQE